MKFACPRCNTRYSIADEKVPPAKTLRFPCKKCGNVIRLRRKATPAQAEDPKATAVSPAPPARDLELGESTRVAPLEELNKLRGQTQGEDVESLGMGGPEVATKVANIEEIRRALANDREGRASPAQPTASEPPAEDADWFVLISGKQEGPVATTAVIGMLERQEIDRRTYVWRDGMDNWQRLGEVSEFSEKAQQAGDAAWRVIAPVDNATAGLGDSGGFGESTVAMNIADLQEQLAKARSVPEEEQAPPEHPADALGAEVVEPEMFDTRATEAMEPVPLEAETTLNDADDGQQAHRATEQNPQAPELVDALAGIPTGESLSRHEGMSGVITEELSNPGAEQESQTPFSDGFHDPFAAQPSPDAYARPSTLDPSEGPLDPIGLSFEDADSNGEALQDEVPPSAEYLNAPPGESTRVFMATAGLYRRRRNHRIAAVLGVLGVAVFATFIALDVTGVMLIPGMGLFFEKTGLEDPNLERAEQRINEKLEEEDLAPDERAALEAKRAKLRNKLMGGGKTNLRAQGMKVRRPNGPRPHLDEEGVKDTQTMNADERSIAEAVFADERKSDTKIVLSDPEKISTPNLPNGLGQDAIAKVIMENSSAMTLCLTESMRKGEKLSGRMEIELTIAPDGSVPEVNVSPAQFRNSVMATCTAQRIRNWKFPRFNGEPVTVSYPYLLQQGF